MKVNYYKLLLEWNAEPTIYNNSYIIARTIDHNYLTEASSFKLYYYDNSKLFISYTGGEDAFDIFSLVLKVKNREEKLNWELPQAIHFIAQKFGFAPKENEETQNLISLEDFKLLDKYDKNNIEFKQLKYVELPEYDDTILKNLPKPIITPWVKEGITIETMKSHNICYNPRTNSIVIPHYDLRGRLIGIRERLLDTDAIEMYGKYKPAYLGGTMYRHPLSFNLYNLNYSKDNIKKFKKAFIFESEKSTLQYSSFMGEENDISVAVCGSNVLLYHLWLLMELGVDEIIIGFIELTLYFLYGATVQHIFQHNLVKS